MARMLVTALLVMTLGGALGCGGATRTTAVDVTGTVHFESVEGGSWVLRADDGTLYEGAGLPAELKIEGARVDVRLVPRKDRTGVAPGLACDIVSARAVECRDPCGPPQPALTVEVVDAITGLAVQGAALASVVLPPAGGRAECLTGGAAPLCVLDAGAGPYAFDVTAAGYEPSHLELTVEAWTPVPGVCCHPAAVPQSLTVRLVPAGGAEVPLEAIRAYPPPQRAFPFTTGFHESARLVIGTDADWASAWATLWQPYSEKPALPAIDFRTQMVVLAALGDRPYANYDVEIGRAFEDASSLTVWVTERTPAPGCGLLTALSQPVAIAKLPRWDGAVTFVEQSEPAACVVP